MSGSGRESRRLAKEYRAGKANRDALVRQKAAVEKQLATAKKVNSLAEQQLADANQVYGEAKQQRGPRDQYTQQLELVSLKNLHTKPNIYGLDKLIKKTD